MVIQSTSFDQCQVLSSSFDILSITDLHKIFFNGIVSTSKKFETFCSDKVEPYWEHFVSVPFLTEKKNHLN